MLVFVMCLFMIVAGGMVTSMDAGDAVPDWPLSYGSLLPPMIGNVFWEHGHRLVGMALGLFTIGLTVALARTEGRRWVRVLGYVALPAVCVQGALGGLRVKIVSSEALQDFLFVDPTGADVEFFRVAVAIVHTATAQSILCLIAAITLVTSRGWWVAERPSASPYTRRLRLMCVLTALFVFAQLLLGALRRHTDGPIIYHAIGAAVVAISVASVVRRVFVDFANVRALVRPAVMLLLLVAFQLVLGIASWMLTATAIVQSLHLPQIDGSAEFASAVLSGHVAVGAAMLALCVVMTIRCYRHLGLADAVGVGGPPLAEGGMAAV